MDRWKSRPRKKKQSQEETQKREDADARKGKKVAKHCVFPMFCGSGGSKSRLARAAGAEPAGQIHAVVARSAFGSEHVQITTCSGHLRASRCRPNVGKVHTVVARGTFGSQKCQALMVLSLF